MLTSLLRRIFTGRAPARDPLARAAALLAEGRTAEGLQCLRAAVEAHPQDPQLHALVARVCATARRFDEAIEAYDRALTLRPGLAAAADELAALLKLTGRYDEAEDRCRAAIAESGDSAKRRQALAGALFEQGRVDEAIRELETSLAMQPDAPEARSDLLRALNYAQGRDPAAVYEAHRAWDERHARPLLPASPPSVQPLHERRVRVGYVSPYFRKHAVTFFLESVIEHHDYSAFEVLLYADVEKPDEYSARLKSYGAQWRSTVGLGDEALARRVREDGVDILVDLSGHTPRNRLLAFARKPAPVQVTWNGYPNTTGMAAMDYRVTDPLCDPPGATGHLHSETLVRLPQIFMSWRPPAAAPQPGPLPAIAAGRLTFGSFHPPYKITPMLIALWLRILDAVPGARLILFAIPEGRATVRLREAFAAAGERVDIRPRLSHEAFLEAHREVDIALDSFPYHGTTTTCFTLWMGVPVVSLTGPTFASRVGLTLLSNIGLAYLAAATPDAYIDRAVQLAGDRQALAALRAGLRARMAGSPLADGRACARALEDAYRTMLAKA